MQIKNVLVTGASGKVGRRLVPALLAAGYRVRAVRHTAPLEAKGAEVVSGSVSDAAGVRRLLQDMEAVCHLATCKEDPEKFVEVSVRGTFNLLENARLGGALKRFILASGDAALGIYFYPHPQPLDENTPLQAYPGCYALSKVMEETLCRQYAIQYGLPTTTLRFSWIQAEDDLLAHMTLQPPDFGVPDWRALAATDRQRECFQQGRDGVACLRHPGGAPYIRHVVAVEDVVASFLCALESSPGAGETFNIAAPAPFSYDVLSRHIAQRMNLPVIDFEQGTYHDFAININRARSMLGFNPKYDALAIADQAIQFRERGGPRSEAAYKG